MANRKNNNFIVQGSILAFAGILVRIIGLVYRVPLNNILGEEGTGYYSAAYDVYSILLLLSSLSLPLAVSKLVSARVVVGEYKNAFKIYTSAIVFALLIGLASGFIAFFGADFFANLMGYPSSAAALKVLAPTLVMMSVVGALRGYFQGLGTMVPTAFSQVLEQIANAIVSLVAAKQLYDIGTKIDESRQTASTGSAYGAAGGTLGTLIGAFIALAFLVVVYLMYQKRFRRKIQRDRSRNQLEYSEVYKMIIVTIVPVLVSTTIYNFSNLIDSGIFANIMEYLGQSEKERASMWGIYSGKYKTLTTVPIAVASALASSIVPSIVSSLEKGEKGQIVNKIDSSIKFTMLIAIPCGIGLMVLGEPIINMLFPNAGYIEETTRLMMFSLFTVLTFSLSTITNAILQGIDKLKIPIINAGISLGVHVVLLPIILLVFKWSIYGVVFADCIFALIICILNDRAIKKYVGYKIKIFKTFILPLGASIIMGTVAFVSYKGIYALLHSNSVSTLVAILAAVIIYFMLLILLRIVDEATLYSIPKGSILVKIAKRFHLL